MELSNFCEMLKEFTDSKTEILPESRLTEDLGLCSFDMMLILDTVERKIQREVCLDNLELVKTVGDLYCTLIGGDKKYGEHNDDGCM